MLFGVMACSTIIYVGRSNRQTSSRCLGALDNKKPANQHQNVYDYICLNMPTNYRGMRDTDTLIAKWRPPIQKSIIKSAISQR